MKWSVVGVLGLAGLAGGFYAAVAVYGAMQITTRARLLPEVEPESIAPEWEAVDFESRGDRKQLAGWWFRSDGERALVLVHGHGQNRVDKNWGSDKIAREFLQRGFSVLMFDLRGHGESAFDRQSFGVRERNDVLGALDFVVGQGFSPGNVAMIGISYGAASLLMAAPEMPEVGAIVDSPFAEIWPVILAEIPRRRPWMARMRPRPGIQLAARLLYRINLGAARPIDAVALVGDRPILFIHGADDAYIPPHHSERLYAAHGHPESELWLVPGADHALTYSVAPDEFITRMVRFVDAQLSRGGTPARAEKQEVVEKSPGDGPELR